ncbi:hypothetical protein BH23PLA1_BH23PLA1_31290 [soil metagenome]
MCRLLPITLSALLALPVFASIQDDDDKAETVSFLKDVAPILVENCVGCHNPRKAESRYDLTTFSKLAEGGAMGEGIMLEPGDPDLSYFVELIREDGIPRMPYDTDPLPKEKIEIIEKWVLQGAEYDGDDPDDDWVAMLNRSRTVEIPERYPRPMPITALAFGPDGDSILTSGYHEINAFDLESGALAHRTPGLGERVYDIAVSPDGQWMATASGDPGQFGLGRLWKVAEDGAIEPAGDLVESEDAVFAAAFRPDGKHVAFAGADRAIRVFEVESGERVAQIEDHADWIFDIAYSPDGKRIASASRDKTSKVFDAEAFESLVTFPGHGDTVYSVAFSGDGQLVASGGEDKQVRLWNHESEAKQARNIQGFEGPVFGLLFADEGKQLVTTGADGKIRVFDPDSGKPLHTLEGHNDWVYSLALSPDGKTLASGSWDGEVRLWGLEEAKLIKTFLAAPGHQAVAEASRESD